MGDDAPTATTRSRIIAAAAQLIAEGGAEAATTRAVAIAAQVQAPTIYRLFGDKDGLLEAVAEQTMAQYVVGKGLGAVDPDPVEELRRGWDAHVAFGLAHPALFGLMSRARAGRPSRATLAGLDVLRERMMRIARTGRLRCTAERAVDLVHAIGTGTILALLAKPEAERADLAARAWNAVFAAIIGEQPLSRGSPAGAASALHASLPDIDVLSPGERQLLCELLERIAEAENTPA